MEQKPRERSAREVREHLADVINDAIRGRITYITSNGRRVAGVVPLDAAEALAEHREAGQVTS
jgi:prevent-host-death family protein